MDAVALGLLNVLKRGATLEITDGETEFSISTEILDTNCDGAGGLQLALAGSVDEGTLHVSSAALATATRDDAYEFRCGALHVQTGAEGEPAVGPAGFFTENAELLAEHRAGSTGVRHSAAPNAPSKRGRRTRHGTAGRPRCTRASGLGSPGNARPSSAGHDRSTPNPPGVRPAGS